MFRKSLSSTAAVAAALVALGGSALAADLPSRAAPPVYIPPPPPVFTWTGVYIGGDIGYRFGTSSSNVFPTGTGPSAGANFGKYGPGGVTGGAHIGYNYQVAQYVFGVEGDFNGSSYSGSQSVANASLTTRSDMDASIRGRIGYAWDRALIYATGGAAFAPFKNQFSYNGFSDTTNSWRTGWTVGAGVEYAVNNNWSIRAEYRYSDYGHYTNVLYNTTGAGSSIRKHDTDNTVRVGISYKFDTFGMPGPVVAKY